MTDLYYTAPTDKVFNEVRLKAIEIWRTYDDEYGYASGKVERITDLKNVQDNVMYIIAMFDSCNQHALAGKLSEEARGAIRGRLIAGGTPAELIIF